MEKEKINSGFIIGGCTMIGMGMGYFFGNMKAFMFMGIGLGLVGVAVIQMSNRDNNRNHEA